MPISFGIRNKRIEAITTERQLTHRTLFTKAPVRCF